MTNSLPNFVYPAPVSSGQSYIYNYNDVVNVSWTWGGGPSDASNSLILWLAQAGEDPLYSHLNVTVATAGSYPSSLNFTNLNYPTHGHFNLWTHFGNGTVVPGQNSADFVVNEDKAASSQCHNCSSNASGVIPSTSPSLVPVISASPTGTTFPSSNSASTSTSTPVPTTSITPPPPPAQQNSSLSRGAIAGIVIGAIAGVIIVAVIGIYCGRRSRMISDRHVVRVAAMKDGGIRDNTDQAE